MNRRDSKKVEQTDEFSTIESVFVSNRKANGWEKFLTALSIILFIILFPLALPFCIAIIAQYQRIIVFRLGKLRGGRPLGPGLVFILPCIDDYHIMDLRTAMFDVCPQEILTKDAVTITVDAVIYYRMQDPLSAILQVASYDKSTMLLAQTALRKIAGTQMLNELLSKKEKISLVLQQILDEATDPWGVKVERVEIKEVRLPVALQRAMAAEAEATREAKAKAVAAQGELSAAQSLKEAADIISTNPTALQLRYLQTLVSIASEKNSTILFPFAVDMLSAGVSEDQYCTCSSPSTSK